MAVALGCLVVVMAVLVGFTMAGGHVGALIHPSEIITIGGAALGALVIMSPTKVLRDLWHGIVLVFRGTPYGRNTCIELLGLFYALAALSRREGTLALDEHLSAPETSNIFQKFPLVAKNHHACSFVCEALSLVVGSNSSEQQLRSALNDEIGVIEREHHAAVGALSRLADSLPGFGIVAAVLGIVVTMQAIDGPVEEIGHKVGAALVGTFLGILMAYGFFAPMASRLEALGEHELTFLRSAATAAIALHQGNSPRDVVQSARRVLGSDCRPGLREMKGILGEA